MMDKFRYYLDTNALRSLAAWLPRNANDYGIYSSILAVSEIISGMNEKSFERRKSIIKSLSTLNFNFIRYTPEALIPLAYSVFDAIWPGYADLLLDLCSRMGQFPTYEDLCSSKKYMDLMQILHAVDENSRDFTDKLPEQFLSGDAHDLNQEYLARWSSAEDICENLHKVECHFGGMMIDRYGQEKVKRYNHSLDLYYLALAKYEDKKTSRRERPGRNDYIDLQHIMYLFQDGIMVTDDKRLTETIQEIDPNRVISIETLKSIISR